MSAPPPLNRRQSEFSALALDTLSALEAEILDMETNNSSMEQFVVSLGEHPSASGVEELIKARNELRQQMGNLEKFQSGKVDAIVTAE
jgi:hypothetical protein